MPICPECGERLPDGAKFCKSCGAAIDSNPQPEKQKNQNQKKKKVSLKSILTTALITVLTGLLIGFFGNGSGKEQVSSEVSGMTDEEIVLNGIAPNPYGDLMGSKSLKQAVSINSGNDEFEGSFGSLDDLSDSDLQEYEEKLFGDDLKKWRESYAGTWQSVGLYVTELRKLENLKNAEVAELIDRNMVPTDNIKFIFNNRRKGTAAVWINGELNVEGEHSVGENGIMTINAPDTLPTYMWMYSSAPGVLFSYVYYVEDDGTEMASCIKFNRPIK